ncbi:MAG TPA: hypothetical protein VHB50_17610 [Bryobacteraceae bacterium]|nr:hypothetical protein [Bryobacteraceae bacterium]
MLWLALACPVAAQSREYKVRHQHFRHGGEGILVIDADAISFEEHGKQAKHSRQWRYDDIQQLVLSPETLKIVTYEDQRWELGRDRVYVFDRLPPEFARDWYPVFASHLDRRFVAALADEKVKPDWRIPAKLIHGRGGSEGVLLAAASTVVYMSNRPGESRTWRIGDIENVSSSDPFDLTITTRERAFRFQLKQVLSEARFTDLWRRVNRANGLQILISNHSTGERQ